MSGVSICVRNLCRQWSVDTRLLRSIARSAVQALPRTAKNHLTGPTTAVAVFLVGARPMAALNERFLGHDGATDVISFDYASHEPPPGGARLPPSHPRSHPHPARQQPRPTGFMAAMHAGSTGLTTSHEPAGPGGARLLPSHPVSDTDPARQQPRSTGFMAHGQFRKEREAPHEPARPAQPSLDGEIFICLDEARRQAGLFGTTWEAEVVRYLVHGLLHLCGHDDLEPAARRRMKRVENRIVGRLADGFDFKRLGDRASVPS